MILLGAVTCRRCHIKVDIDLSWYLSVKFYDYLSHFFLAVCLTSVNYFYPNVSCLNLWSSRHCYRVWRGLWTLLTSLSFKEKRTEPDNSHISLSHFLVTLSLLLMLHFLCLKIRESAGSVSYLQVFVSHLSWQMASALWAFTGFENETGRNEQGGMIWGLMQITISVIPQRL